MPKLVLSEMLGMNANGAALQLRPGEAQMMQNVRTRPFKNWRKRNGITATYEQTGPVLGIFELELENIVVPIIIDGSGGGGSVIVYPQINIHIDPVEYPNGVGNPDPNETGEGRNHPNGLDPGGVTTLKKKTTTGSNGCTYTGDFSAINHDYTGFSYSIAVAAAAGCSWNVTTDNASMIHLGLGTVHLSGGTVAFTVTQNNGESNRTGNIYFKTMTSGGAAIATVVVTQTPEPVPGSCPAGLDPSYFVTTGQVTKYYNPSSSICWADDPALYYTYNGSAATVGPCTWQKYFVGPGATTIASSISLNPGSDWFVTLTHDRVFGSWQNVYRKYTGSTPIGTYTDPTGCAVPSTVTVS